ncbi:hypothetical protein [Micromonospora aurantiaca (nom. illeg.)]|uniref:hypothetical protein n=1 Tax=Micromonospora aurantiaca (nom. illeg.) TaxID=47850 RepID=UPI0037888F47
MAVVVLDDLLPNGPVKQVVGRLDERIEASIARWHTQFNHACRGTAWSAELSTADLAEVRTVCPSSAGD